MENQAKKSKQSSSSRRSLKRKVDEDFEDDNRKISSSPSSHDEDLIPEIRTQVENLESTFSSNEADRASAKRAIHVLSEFAKNEEIVNVVVDCGAVPALVRHLQVPSLGSEGDGGHMPYEHEVEKGSAFTLGLLAIKPEHQQLIVEAGALPHLVGLLKRHKNAQNSRAVNGVIRRAADAITNLAHENSSIKTRLGSKVVFLLLLNCWCSLMQRCKEQLQEPCELWHLKMTRTKIRSLNAMHSLLLF